MPGLPHTASNLWGWSLLLPPVLTHKTHNKLSDVMIVTAVTYG